MPNNKNFSFYIVILIFALCIFNFYGCATAPKREALPRYDINGISYLPLVSLCDLRGINWEYDTFARTITLNRGPHKINLMIGQTLVLVDGIPQHLRHPVDLYQGAIVVPYKFKEQVLDDLFKEPSRLISAAKLKIKKVVLDAGHGGRDPGTMGRSGVREKDINLDIAKRLKKLLEDEGIAVVLTRPTDKFIPLSARVDIANNSQADLFISLHANANRVRGLNGFEVYYISSSIDDSARALSAAQSAELNLESKCFASQSLDLRATLWDMLNTYNRAESITLAQAICKTVKSGLNTRILGIKGANFHVLRGVRMPAVLIEVGFLSNGEEERMLKNDYYRQRIAEDINEGIFSYAKELT